MGIPVARCIMSGCVSGQGVQASVVQAKCARTKLFRVLLRLLRPFWSASAFMLRFATAVPTGKVPMRSAHSSQYVCHASAPFSMRTFRSLYLETGLARRRPWTGGGLFSLLVCALRKVLDLLDLAPRVHHTLLRGAEVRCAHQGERGQRAARCESAESVSGHVPPD